MHYKKKIEMEFPWSGKFYRELRGIGITGVVKWQVWRRDYFESECKKDDSNDLQL